MGLIYDPRGLSGVMIVRSEMARVLQMVLEPILVISQARMSQLRRI
jgi:hypothetical protein